jgi:hypothetical protein
MYAHLNEQMATQHQTEMREQAAHRAGARQARRMRRASQATASRRAFRPNPAPAR